MLKHIQNKQNDIITYNSATKYQHCMGEDSCTNQFPMSFPVEYKLSVFEKYLETLQHSETEQIHIFGYSGENDQHINNAITNSSNIKEIIYYCSPADAHYSVYDAKTFSVNELFNHNKNKKVILHSWDDVWDLICN